jgi:plastocyanin
MGRGLLIAAVAALGAVFAAPALAANQTVSVTDNQFVDPRGAIKPGESVTWNATGVINPHNVHFEDLAHTAPLSPIAGTWTTARAFPNAGTYRYYCQIHGGPGGQGMSGIVHVNADANIPPVAGLSFSPTSAEPGQTVTFSSGSIDFDGTISRHQWDLDGDGSFETDTGTTTTTSRAYASTAVVTVKLRVTDNQGATDERTQSLRINSPPSASFTASPNPAQTGQRVTFDGSASSDPGGAITRYQWDLDGDGSFETDTAGTATASRSYAAAAAVTVKLQVTDDQGVTDETTRPLQITARPRPVPSVIAPAVVRPPLSPSFAASKKTLAVSKSGRFSYSFGAGAGLTGTLGLRSVAKVRVAARRQVSLGTKSFTVPASGVVKLSWKLSRKNLRILKRNKRIKFAASATLRNAAGGQSSAATTLTLKKPAR